MSLIIIFFEFLDKNVKFYQYEAIKTFNFLKYFHKK
jgi:hypothetical protein